MAKTFSCNEETIMISKGPADNGPIMSARTLATACLSMPTAIQAWSLTA